MNLRTEFRDVPVKAKQELKRMNNSALSFRETLRKGSKTFSFASLFFSPQIYTKVTHLYAWCRACDDITDGSTLGFNPNPKGLSMNRVDQIWEMTQSVINGDHAPNHPEFHAFGQLVQDFQIPVVYAQDLILGMQHDALEKRCQTQEDLATYCYQVAGTVGLMMCHILGIKHSRALKNAVELGIALQLTNIARDIREDFEVGRIYIPLEWLEELNIPPHQLLEPQYEELVNFLVRRLLAKAHHHYRVGLEGLMDLPLRAALAVSIAACNYSAIGDQVKRLGSEARKKRTVLRFWDKARATTRGVLIALLTVPRRILNPRPNLKITEVWRYS